MSCPSSKFGKAPDFICNVEGHPVLTPLLGQHTNLDLVSFLYHPKASNRDRLKGPKATSTRIIAGMSAR